MSNLKKYVVVKRFGDKDPVMWLTEMYEEVKRNNPEFFEGAHFVTTFNADEELKEGEIETLKAENSKMRAALEMAELELKAIYPRLGFRSSNVLDTVTKTLAEL